MTEEQKEQMEITSAEDNNQPENNIVDETEKQEQETIVEASDDNDQDFEPTIESVIEAVLFASDEPITPVRLVKITEISIKELVLKIAHIMDKKITINELLDTPGSPVRRCPDTSKVERLTGYSPVILLEKGILDTYKWYKEHLDAVSVR